MRDLLALLAFLFAMIYVARPLAAWMYQREHYLPPKQKTEVRKDD